MRASFIVFVASSPCAGCRTTAFLSQPVPAISMRLGERLKSCGHRRLGQRDNGAADYIAHACRLAPRTQDAGAASLMMRREPATSDAAQRTALTRREFSQATSAFLATASIAIVAGPAAAGAAPDFKPELVWSDLNRESFDGQDQTTFSPRFTAYLARFLLNKDRTSRYWWEKQRSKVSAAKAQELSRKLVDLGSDQVFNALDVDGSGTVDREEFSIALTDSEENFAKFQASVNFGLRKYQGKDGVRRLFLLLLEDFGDSVANKRQIALLFSLMEGDQPVEYIKKLIGETDNASIVNYRVENGGAGYTLEKPPVVTVDAPPFLEDSATAKVTLKPTGRIFRIKLKEAGKGYSKPPEVTVSAPKFGGTAAKAIATLKGDKVAGIVVTNPGSGYRQDDFTTVTVGPPTVSALPEGGDANLLEQFLNSAQAEVVLDMAVSSVVVVHKGSGYGCDLPVTVTVEPPPPKVDYANYGVTAKVTPVLSPPPEGEILRSWLPPASLKQEVTELLPDNLVPKFDPCLGKFYISPIDVLDPNYCVYFDDEKFKIYPSQKIAPYFSFLDGPRARYPVEKEKPLDLSVFLRFSACGAVCGATAHALLVPIDVVKTRMQSEPDRYPAMLPTFKKLLKEEGGEAFLLGAGATVVGYLLYGGVSFGLTEFFKRKFVEVAGSDVAALYPVPILLFASACAAVFAATAVTPFETLRIRTVTIPNFPRSLGGALVETLSRGKGGELFAGVPVLLLAEIPFMMAKFAVFDATSKLAYALLPNAAESVTLSLAVSLVSGMIAGVAASLVSQPSDTVLTEVNDGGGGGTIDVMGTFRSVYSEGGVKAFYKGALPRCIKSAINIAIQFFLYDFCKRLAKVSPEDIKVFFDVMSGVELNVAGTTSSTARTIADLIAGAATLSGAAATSVSSVANVAANVAAAGGPPASL